MRINKETVMSGNSQLSSDQVVVVSHNTAATVEGVVGCSA